MYSRGDSQQPGSVAAIKGFDYNGLRVKLTELNYEFIDLPNTISAIQVFLKNKSDHLMAYSGPMDYYLDRNKISLTPDITYREFFTLDSHIALNKKSPKLDMLNRLFTKYAVDNKLTKFSDLKLPE